ncbi:MAG: alpha/beta hydrolase [Natrialbaceae archaeon]|nr:alpha/beta hydrolase [Natrialbaceae archaeon]
MVETLSVEANGMEFSCLTAGDGDQLALCLHGFPDDATSMRPLMERLADAGYRAVAPYMRGYDPTGPAPDGDYRTTTLGADAIALAQGLGDGETVLVGHDWGAIASYAAARQAPEVLDRIVTMAVPPNFAQQMLGDPAQLARSWYIWFIQLEGFAEAAIQMNDFEFLEYLWQTWSPGWDYSDERLSAVTETFRSGDTLSNALAYYRQMIQPLVATDGGGISVPGLVLGGVDDGCIGVEYFASATDAFATDSDCKQIEDAGHFLHQERPEAVGDAMLSFLESA